MAFQQVCETFQIVDLNPFQREAMRYFVKKKAHVFVNLYRLGTLQTGSVFENVNPFSWILKAISSEKSCLISKPFLTCLLDVRTLDFFPPAES